MVLQSYPIFSISPCTVVTVCCKADIDLAATGEDDERPVLKCIAASAAKVTPSGLAENRTAAPRARISKVAGGMIIPIFSARSVKGTIRNRRD